METIPSRQSPSRSEALISRIWSDHHSLCLGRAEFLLAPDELSVKKIRVSGKLLIEAIYVAVRDAQWGTGTINLRQALIQTMPDGELKVQWQAQVSLPGQVSDPMVYDWQITLMLGENGLRFEAKGLALQDFLRNRIGICVLLPDALAGYACQIEHSQPDEQTSQSGRLPVDIAPHQPFLNIAKLQVQAAETTLALSFSGEVFEMEDQRNWTDASYKIYGTPLALPWPVSVSERENVEQCFQACWSTQQNLRVDSTRQTCISQPTPAFSVSWQDVAYPLVSIGIKLFGNEVPSVMHDLRPNFIQLELSAGQWRKQHQTVLSELEQKLHNVRHVWDGGVGLAIAVRQPQLMTGQDWAGLKAFVASAAAPCRLLRIVAVVDDIPEDCLNSISGEWITASAQALGDCMLCVATTRYFAELNRAQAHLAELPLRAVGYGINPQVHVFGDSELFDTLDIQSQTARQAQRLGCGVHWWSVTLNPFNYSAEDPRLHGDLGAAWWLGSYIAALRGGVSSASWFSLGGAWGIQANSPLHRVMAQICRIVAKVSPTNTVAIFNGPGVVGLRIADAAWLVNCTDTPQMGWLDREAPFYVARQVWLAPWQILSLSEQYWAVPKHRLILGRSHLD